MNTVEIHNIQVKETALLYSRIVRILNTLKKTKMKVKI